MKGIWAPDCDCDAIKTIGVFQIIVSRFSTDADAIARYRKLGPSAVGIEAIHGPSGHLLNVVR